MTVCSVCAWSNALRSSWRVSNTSNTLKDGAILDGFPRTLAQAQSLEKISESFQIKKVIVFEANRDELIKRILHRGETSGRSDDTEESISVRLEVYEKDTEPLIEYYDNKKVTVKINAVGEVGNIYSELSKEF